MRPVLKSSNDAGSGTGEALKLPLMLAVNVGIVALSSPRTVGETFVKLRLMPVGSNNSVITEELNETVSLGSAALSVRDAPEPKTASVKLPLR